MPEVEGKNGKKGGSQDDRDGHWEKVMRQVDRFFHVNGEKPSNLPNSFVVSKSEAELGIFDDDRKSDRYRLNDLN